MKESAKTAVKQRKGAYRAFFENPLGKEILEDLKNECRFTQSTYSNDTNYMAYLNGKRDVLVYIEQMLKQKS